MVQVAKDVYTMTGAGSNASFVVTDEGVLAFDSDIRNNDVPFIRKVTDKKVVYLFASHASGDHSTGAWYFREDKPVYIGTRDQIRAYYQNELKEFNERKAQGAPLYKPAELPPPSMGFDENLTVLLGGLTFQAKAEGYGHTSGDMTMYIPQRRVMFMGDLLNNELHPGQAEAAGVFFADIQGTIDILNRIIDRNLAVDTLRSRPRSGSRRKGNRRCRGPAGLFHSHAGRSGKDGDGGKDPGTDSEGVQGAIPVRALRPGQAVRHSARVLLSAHRAWTVTRETAAVTQRCT